MASLCFSILLPGRAIKIKRLHALLTSLPMYSTNPARRELGINGGNHELQRLHDTSVSILLPWDGNECWQFAFSPIVLLVVELIEILIDDAFTVQILCDSVDGWYCYCKWLSASKVYHSLALKVACGHQHQWAAVWGMHVGDLFQSEFPQVWQGSSLTGVTFFIGWHEQKW